MRHSHLFWLFSFFLVSPTLLVAKPAPEMPAGLQAAYQQARHQIEVIQDKGQPTRWRAVNANNHLSVDFDGKGILAHSLKDDWRLSMELTRLGEPDQLKPVNKPSVQIKDNRLTYDRGTITEWYINDPKGLEQGFTLDKPLAKERLVLQFVLGGDVKPSLIDKGKTLQLITPQGKKLRYEGLKAWDAKGRDLNATLQLKDKILQLQVAVVDAAYPVTIDPWLVEEEKFRASDPDQISYFGHSVAIDGNTAVVGAEEGDGRRVNSGSAYVFVRSGTMWNQQAKLIASNGEGNDDFGWSVAVSGDIVVIGARFARGYQGAAYVYVRSNGIWNEQARLTATDSGQTAFGYSVAISGDTVVVGMPHDDSSDSILNSGSAYVFVQNGSIWDVQDKLVVTNAAQNDTFGHSVAISGDTAVVGMPNDDDIGTDSGSAYIFTRSGVTWNLGQGLTVLDLEAGDKFGWSVAIRGDTAVVGAPYSTNGGATPLGAAYVFARNGGGGLSRPGWRHRILRF